LPFLENGLACLKPTLTRDYVPLSEPSGVSVLDVFIFIVSFIGIAWLLWMVYKYYKSVLPSTKNPVISTIDNINGYFRRKNY